MKKTSTRLATIGIVIVLGAFAIALAQYDANNRENEPPTENVFATNPGTPIAVDGEWDLRGGIVRGNNDGQAAMPEKELNSLPDLGGNVYADEEMQDATSRNPLREAVSLVAMSNEFSESEVVPAAGEEPANNPPSWLAGGTAALPSLPSTAASDSGQPASAGPSAPAGNGGVLPALPSFPGTGLPATNLPGTGQREASTPIQPPASQTLPNLPAGAGYQLGATAQRKDPVTAPSSNLATGNDLATGFVTPRSDATPFGNTPPPPTSQLANPQSPNPGPSDPNGFPNAGANFPSDPFPQSNEGANRAAASAGVGGSAGLGGLPQSVGRTAAINKTLASLVSNQPGNRYLDGSQNPIMLIQKRAPEEIQVGKKATFVIVVRNAGNATAHDVTVVDSVPRGSRFENASPAITPSADGLLTWKLGEMAAGDERTINLQITPEVQGEVGSVASVHFVAQASVRTVATLPKIEITMESQPDVLIGDSQAVSVTIKNTGTGVAKNVRLEADIPPQLRHESGEAQLDAPIGDMRPHEVIQRTLTAAAVEAGQSKCVFRAVTDDGVQAEQSVPVNVRAPSLAASIQGPALRYLERQATYRITVMNSGTAAATDLDFVIRLPSGLKYISTNVPSDYDPNTHSVNLGLEELPAGRPAPIEITVLPVELGPQVITFAANGALGAVAEAKAQVQVDGLAELAFTVGQDNGTIETGASSTYSVQVTNIGNKPDKDVQLVVQLPAGTELVDVNAPGVEYRLDGSKLLFAPIPEMKSKDQRTFRFEVRYNRAGNQVVRTQLTSQNWPVAVVKEEGTLVYNDQN